MMCAHPLCTKPARSLGLCVRHYQQAYRNRDRAQPQPVDLHYEQAFVDQEGRCAICGRLPQPGRKFPGLYRDHDHASGAARGLLCPQCNNGLGMFQDDPRLLRQAIHYLAEHRGRQGAPFIPTQSRPERAPSPLTRALLVAAPCTADE